MDFDREGGPSRLLKLQLNHIQEVLRLRNTVKTMKEYHWDHGKYLRSLDLDSDKSSYEHELKRAELDIINIWLENLFEEEKLLIKKKLDLLAKTIDSSDDLFHDVFEVNSTKLMRSVYWKPNMNLLLVDQPICEIQHFSMRNAVKRL